MKLLFRIVLTRKKLKTIKNFVVQLVAHLDISSVTVQDLNNLSPVLTIELKKKKLKKGKQIDNKRQ